jgi:hypothetical protein
MRDRDRKKNKNKVWTSASAVTLDINDMNLDTRY